MFWMYKIQAGVVENFGKMGIYWIWGVIKNLNMKWIISGQVPDSPPPPQGASDPISGLTGLCLYLL